MPQVGLECSLLVDELLLSCHKVSFTPRQLSSQVDEVNSLCALSNQRSVNAVSVQTIIRLTKGCWFMFLPSPAPLIPSSKEAHWLNGFKSFTMKICMNRVASILYGVGKLQVNHPKYAGRGVRWNVLVSKSLLRGHQGVTILCILTHADPPPIPRLAAPSRTTPPTSTAPPR